MESLGIASSPIRGLKRAHLGKDPLDPLLGDPILISGVGHMVKFAEIDPVHLHFLIFPCWF